MSRDPDEAYETHRADLLADDDELVALLARSLDGDTTARTELRTRRMNRHDWPGADGQNLKLSIDQHLRGAK